jgi:hypothetical protein
MAIFTAFSKLLLLWKEKQIALNLVYTGIHLAKKPLPPKEKCP